MKKTAFGRYVWYTAFVLFCLVSVSSHFTQKLSARYITESTATDGARVASFHGGEVTTAQFAPSKQLVANNKANADAQTLYYVFEAEFTLTFEECEVTRTFSFSISMKDTEMTSLACPETGVAYKTLKPNGAEFETVTYDYFSGDTATSFGTDVVYYSVNNEWSSSATAHSGGSVTLELAGGEKIDWQKHTYSYSVLFFVTAEPVTTSSSSSTEKISEDTYITYDLKCAQVD